VAVHIERHRLTCVPELRGHTGAAGPLKFQQWLWTTDSYACGARATSSITVNTPLPLGASKKQESPLPFTSTLGTPDPPDGAARSCQAPVGHSPMGARAPTAVGQASNDAAPITPTNALLRIQIMLSPLTALTRAEHPTS